MNTPSSIEATTAEIRDDVRVRGTYLVRSKRQGVGKTGKAWLQLILGDRTGTIDARVWDNAEQVDRDVGENDIVAVEGQGVRFMDQIQLKVFKIRRLQDDGLDPVQFLPAGNRSPEDLLAAYRGHLERCSDPWLRQLLASYLDDAEWWARFVRAPAAKTIHHAYLGGLAEHTLSMLDLCRTIGQHYLDQGARPLNVDLLVLGAFLHDTGKIEELSAEGGFEYTDKGRLWGHIVLGLDELDRRMRALDGFPDDLVLHLRHLLLSHHGEYEYGSPRRPKTLEAMLLHMIDNLDSRVEIMAQAIRDSGDLDSSWTGYAQALGRHVFRRAPGEADEA